VLEGAWIPLIFTEKGAEKLTVAAPPGTVIVDG
jgi:hypothetical protein